MIKKRGVVIFLGLATLLLISGFTPLADDKPVLASPDELKWYIVDTPSEEDNVVLSPSEINVVVRGSGGIFYAIDIPHEEVYESTDGGVTWEDGLAEALGNANPAAALPVWDMAAAPGNPDLLVVVTDNRAAAYLSDDGGVEWMDTGVPDLGALLISDIAVSSEYDSGNADIAIGTRRPDAVASGDVWVLESGPFAGWKPMELNMDVSSIMFSSNYDEDGVILAIASDTAGTYLCTRHKIGDEWIDVIPPIEIEESESSPAEGEIIVSDLALPSANYGKQAEWIAYVAYYSATEADDVYRIKHGAGAEDAQVSRLDIKGGDKVSIASIDYGAGKLAVGEIFGEEGSANASIYICSNPEEGFPDWEKPSEPPTGGAFSGRANAQVIWSSGGAVVYCGTSSNQVTSASEWALPIYWSGQSLDESAFSISEDGGDTWNQLSLIDTEMTSLSDYALSSDVGTLYLASINRSGFDSLWRSESEALGESWQRILCFDSRTNKIILRPTPEESGGEAIFFAVPDSDYARYSLDMGETWERVYDCPPITDLAVVSDEVLYVLDDNLVHKGTWDGEMWGGIWEWQRDIDTRLSSTYSIDVRGEDFVFVTEDENGDGRLAYSTDGAATFKFTEAVPEPGNIQFIPDEEFTRNRFVYAASSEGKIYRWTIGGSTYWRELNPPHLGFCGLVQNGGALYGAYAYRRGVARTLIPHQDTISASDWDSLTVGLVSGAIFKPGSLKAISNETIDLWALDGRDYNFGANTGCLWVYSDTFVLQAPWPTSPAIDGLIECDYCACQARVFCFRWREIPLAEKYEIWIALDEDFSEVVAQVEDITPADVQSPAWCPSTESLRFSCGGTYYWKVRSCQGVEGEVIHSRWSPPMYFGVKAGTTVGGLHIAPVLEVPEPGSGDVPRSTVFSWVGFPGTTEYEFLLAEDATLTQVVIREEVPTSAYQYRGELDWGTTYFWRVRAIEPLPSEPALGSFTIMVEPQHVSPSLSLSPVQTESGTPVWIWLMIGILTSLTVVVVVFCLVKR
ncbi:MAG: exo-alpha-sialidase [Dehalococcoidia bacterium]|nr:exo-alpha-sialidase [Dehalococcoidia bacterium]